MPKGLRFSLLFNRVFVVSLFLLFSFSTNFVFAGTINLNFNSLPSAQQPSGPNWTYFTLNSRTETQVFQVGLNGSNEPTLFQNTIGVGLPATDANRYELNGVLDTCLTEFILHVRVAVLVEEVNPGSGHNHFGFSFFVNYRGSSLNVGIGTDTIQVVDLLGLRNLSTSLNNTGYHDYVLSGKVGPGGSWTLSRDSVVLGTGNFNTPVPGNALHLGDGSAGGNAQAEVTIYSFTQMDTIPPTIVCRPDTTVNNTPGQCGRQVSFSVLATDNSNCINTDCVPPSNTFFNIGATPVSCIVTDGAGLEDTCTFTVTVNDVQPPVLTCSNITSPRPVAQCSSVVNFSPPASDNCPGVSKVCTPPSGSTFPVGSTPVTCIATDTNSNQDTCSFTITLPRGDMDGNGSLNPADVVLLLNCVFLASGDCNLCFADVNCSGDLSPADVVLELNAVFLGAAFPC